MTNSFRGQLRKKGRLGVLFILVVLMPLVAHSQNTDMDSEAILSKQDADFMFSLDRAGWERAVQKMVHPLGWETRLSSHGTGTVAIYYDDKTGMGSFIKPLYDDEGPPGMIIVGNDYPFGFLPPFTDDYKQRLEEKVMAELGTNYSVRVIYREEPQSVGIDFIVTRK